MNAQTATATQTYITAQKTLSDEGDRLMELHGDDNDTLNKLVVMVQPLEDKMIEAKNRMFQIDLNYCKKNFPAHYTMLKDAQVNHPYKVIDIMVTRYNNQ